MKTGTVIVIGVGIGTAALAYYLYKKSKSTVDSQPLTVDRGQSTVTNSPTPNISRAIDTPVILKYSEPVVLKQADPIRSILTTTQPVVDVPQYSTPNTVITVKEPVYQMPVAQYSQPATQTYAIKRTVAERDLMMIDQPSFAGLSRLLR